ncbi:uncharacterized protein LOC111272044 [Varroa jacobsoni]|uniref:Uncharacterized protein n=1 Tax=Varroa destructor TaxID=109461 RepID=A0A7M7MFC2_VARDE|nr:uncharacterized protein LOC111255067 [Varroa destructor]XP_022672436.1 uncharacterized protein LOC111255067 [Varroa destructor]XP_022672445.1 uncharacterized protein LOC111255067 [Varroa destructor]XP_022672454.1 uncharacterized protein LOC111255067 [Varroa destructor]XP_022672459.1 uncharacterized protein LOC111255067 [Varroa destructor]XP_022672467.1 uncharacterized protein LOC111255067 [Varroa destructor]XP_022672474.1 uncharacterized protein LOC111255067 [Varroa destructor]XP_02267248
MSMQKLTERLDQVKRIFTTSYYHGPGGWPQLVEDLITDVDCVVVFFCVTCTICAVASLVLYQMMRLWTEEFGPVEPSRGVGKYRGKVAQVDCGGQETRTKVVQDLKHRLRM